MKIFRVVGATAKILLAATLIVGHFVMNCIGILICAITEAR